MTDSRYPLKIFFDGACRVCSAEMEHYRQKDHGGRLLFVDISSPDFRPLEPGPTCADFMARMHVQDADGHFYVGVEAFQVIWRACPEPWLHKAAAILNLPGVKQCAMLGYALFARYRYLLPKKSCTDDSCSINARPPD